VLGISATDAIEPRAKVPYQPDFKLKLYSVHPNPLYVKTLPEIIREKANRKNAQRVYHLSSR
jgi:hypothetical protein